LSTSHLRLNVGDFLLRFKGEKDIVSWVYLERSYNTKPSKLELLAAENFIIISIPFGGLMGDENLKISSTPGYIGC
jgi:hypothetical protein